MLKRCISMWLALCLLLTLAACGGKPQTDGAQTTTTTTTTKPTDDPQTLTLAPTFAAMPQIDRDLAEVYRLNEYVAFFAFITPGMDSSIKELVCYDMATDTCLGTLGPIERWVEILPQDDGFAVVDYDSKTYTVYDTACAEQSSVTLAFDGAIGSVAQNGDCLLLSDLRTGQYYVYDLPARTAIPVDTVVGAAEYAYAGNHQDAFLLYSYNGGLFTVTADGQAQFISATAQSVQAAGDTYVGGVVGDYVVFRSLMGAAAEMLPVRGDMESFFSAHGNGFLSSTNDDNARALHYYDLARRTVTDCTVDGYVMDAALWGTTAVAVMYAEGEGFAYAYVDFAALPAEGLYASAYDKTVIDDLRPLPEVSGTAAEILDTYGITVIDDHDFFDMTPYGFTTTAAADDQVAARIEQLQDFLAYFPEGLFKELSEKAPVVIVLCDELGDTAGGLNTLIDGYNVTFLSITGNGDYFCGVAAHELGHAIERGVSLADLDGWTAMQPVEVQLAYSDLSLTVEYTADDKGKTPVWFTDAYGRTDAMEDRATVFEEMYEACVTGDASALDYDGLRQKVAYWSRMLRSNFACCADATFPWDTLFE